MSRLRRRLLALFGQTEAERTAYRNALTLFFGGLLGANLGLLQQLSLEQYVTLVAILAATVMAFLLIGRARSRRYALVTLASYGAIGAYAWLGTDRFAGIDPAAAERLFATLGMWLTAMAIVELTPLIPDPKLPPPSSSDEER